MLLFDYMAELLGVTGFQCSGKDTVADILRDFHGFEPLTSSDVIRDYIKKNDLGEPTRPLLAEVARKLRAGDASAIIQESLQRCKTDRIIISGLYSKAEAEYFTLDAAGKIIKCDADQGLRYGRALSRGRVGDDVDLALTVEAHEVARIILSAKQAGQRHVAATSEQVDDDPVVATVFDAILAQERRPLIGPSRHRPAEVGGEDRVRDLVRDRRRENPIKTPFDRHLLIRHTPPSKGKRRQAARLALGKVHLDRARDRPRGQVLTDPGPRNRRSADLGALRDPSRHFGMIGLDREIRRPM